MTKTDDVKPTVEPPRTKTIQHSGAKPAPPTAPTATPPDAKQPTEK